jgi:hypothetical protein|tara:strand:+ start:3262 stop:4455 length:1194 start_codon:yes stop_codon:yes gene_type:complete
MQDNKILYKIIDNKNFKIKVFRPFNKLCIDFLEDFSKKLKNYKNLKSYPDLIYLMFWCRKEKIKKLENSLTDNQYRLGRGLIFHICPSNVPTNFIYSLFFGLLSGNSNIVKISSKNSKEKSIIISILKNIFDKPKYKVLKNSNILTEYKASNTRNTEIFSSVCDARVIWGGNKAINDIRKFWIPERSIDITFADRYSISMINLEILKNLNLNNLKILAKKFYYDSYLMNQAACNSPHFVFWVGKKNSKLQNAFWKELNDVVENNFIFDDIHIMDKYTNLMKNIIEHDKFNKINMYKNNLYVIDINQKVNTIENIRGKNGAFFQKNINNLLKIKKFISKKCQTLTYFGFEKKELEVFLLNNNLSGIDRAVPIGNALNINPIWDGFNVLNELSRIITIE